MTRNLSNYFVEKFIEQETLDKNLFSGIARLWEWKKEKLGYSDKTKDIAPESY